MKRESDKAKDVMRQEKIKLSTFGIDRKLERGVSLQ